MNKKIFLSLFIYIGLWQFFSGGIAMAKQENLTFTGIERLIVEGSFFSVEVAGYSEKYIDAHIIIPDRVFKDGVKVVHKQMNSELRFWVEKKILSGINLLFGESPKMVFKVPHECDVRIINKSGEVMVEGITSREIQIQTSSGDIDIRRTSTDLQLSSSSGKIWIEGCYGNKDLRASSGNITVHDSDGDLKVETSSGKQAYDGIKGDIFAHSSSGDLNITNHEGGLNLESNSGKQTGRDISITKDSSFRTSSGKIDFDFINDIEDFTFDLTSSSGKIKVGSTNAKGRVVTGNGKILIQGKSSSGGQIYR